MKKHSTLAFLTERKISQLRREAANYWIIYVAAGVADITQQKEVHHAVAGQVVIISSAHEYVQIRESNGFACYVLQINEPSSAEVVKQYMLFMNLKNESVNVINTGKQEKRILTLFQDIDAELNAESEPCGPMLNLLLQELLVRLYHVSPKVLSGMYANKADIVFNICAWLEEDYYHTFTLKTVAAKYNMSISYLAHMFKEITGMSIMRYLLLIRIREAQKYLEQTNLPINEISEKCGFNDVSNFGRTFRKETGNSPSQYRQRCHGERIVAANDPA